MAANAVDVNAANNILDSFFSKYKPVFSIKSNNRI